MDKAMPQARIKKTVRPYGGRRVSIVQERITPQGNKIYTVSIGTKKLSIAHVGLDLREYRENELELL